MIYGPLCDEYESSVLGRCGTRQGDIHPYFYMHSADVCKVLNLNNAYRCCRALLQVVWPCMSTMMSRVFGCAYSYQLQFTSTAEHIINL